MRYYIRRKDVTMSLLNISGSNSYSVGASTNNDEERKKPLVNQDAGAFLANNSILNAPAGYEPNLRDVSVWT